MQFEIRLASDLLWERTLDFSPSLPTNCTFEVPHLRMTPKDALTNETKIFERTGRRRQGVTLKDVRNHVARMGDGTGPSAVVFV